MTEKYIITGLVQGIGFRPDVKRAAEQCGISGSVKNTGGAVEIIARGAPKQLEAFKNLIKSVPMAVITSFSARETDEIVSDGFVIISSNGDNTDVPLVTPDISVCDNCIAEFDDETDRRYRHPFISCTRCGPRYSIIDRLPYDRCNTVMSDFEMCPDCRKEYTDIKDIRCHAQTVACNDCGPVLSYTAGGNPLEGAARTIKSGGVVAVKDIGGYHLVCGAYNENAARRIREIKRRDRKPFAVMFNTVDEIRNIAQVSELEELALKSAARPIVLVKKKNDDFAPSVCAESGSVGAFLPCNPVQHYLTKECGALVMTSANISGEPIITEDERMARLRRETGGFEILSHNRRILTPLDDSVCRIIRGRIQLLRRARGYTPLPVTLDMPKGRAIFAAGGDLKAAFCFAKDGRAYMSQYFGDLENAAAYDVWKRNIKRLGGLLNIEPDIVITDMHPGYFSANYPSAMRAQHHFAHMASVMAEHGLKGSATGFIFDGTGYGTAGNIWGGEIIGFDGAFSRIGGLEYTPLLGGDESAKDAGLTLDCYLIAAGLEPKTANASLIKAALKNNINTVKSSSMGRLFDAVSAMLGICGYNSYEGECAIKLELAAERAKEAYPLTLPEKGGCWNTKELIRKMIKAAESGADTNSIALGFHAAVANAVCNYAERRGERSIVLSGGVFANRILTEMCIDRLEEKGYNVYINERVPSNDGGLALGQVWIGGNVNVCGGAGTC